jgi:hypothetical protein
MQDFIRKVRRKLHSLARGLKPRSDMAPLAEEWVEEFGVPAALREHYARRLRVGLEHVYDQMILAPAT